MSRRDHLRMAGYLGQGSPQTGIPWWESILTGGGANIAEDIASYNAGVTAKEANAAAAAEAPDNSPAMQSAITAAINAGNDPSTVMNLWQNGASAIQMQLLANGAITPDQIVTPGTQPLTSSQLSTYYQNLFTTSPAPAAGSAAAGAVSSDPVTAWLLANWPWLAIGALGLWWVSKKL